MWKVRAKRTISLLVLVLLFWSLPVFSASAKKTEITFWHTYNTQSPEEKVLLTQVIPAFEKEYPDIKVVPQGIPYPDFHQKLVTSVAGGIVPDLVRMDIIWVPEFAEMDALLQLDKMEGFADLKSRVFPGPLSTCAWRGKYYGVPLDTNCQILLYNEDIFKEAGIKSPPKTLDEFEKVARSLTKKDAKGKVLQYGYCLPGPWAWYFLPWVWSGGGAITDPEITKASGYLNSPETIAILEKLVSLYKEGVLAPTIAQSGLGSWEGFGKGIYAMTQDGPWAFPCLEGQYKDLKIGAALFPAGKGGSCSVVGGEDIVIFKGSKNKDAAWKFVQHMLSMEAQIMMATTGQIPVLKAALDDPFIKSHPYYGLYLEQLKTAYARTPHPTWSRIEETIQVAFQAAVAGKSSVKDAMDDAAKKVDALLK